jgi:hypothetical protein
MVFNQLSLQMEKAEKVKQGRKNRKSGQKFELIVRKDLESKGWTVCKWSNNIEWITGSVCNGFQIWDFKDITWDNPNGRIIPSKHKFNPFGRCMVQGTGFPDFIAFRLLPQISVCHECGSDVCSHPKPCRYEVIGLEAKSGKYLDKEEKAKCAVYFSNKTFSRIVIASKCAEGIKYEDFK